MTGPLLPHFMHRFRFISSGLRIGRSETSRLQVGFRILLVVLQVGILGATIGCGTHSGTGTGPSQVAASVSGVATGSVHGGQQPISGATIQIWGVGTTGYSSAAVPLITSINIVTSDGSGVGGNASNGNNSFSVGSFTIPSGSYSCPSSNLVYMTSVGGNPGIGSKNPQAVLMAGLGSCSYLLANAATTFLNVDEVTTVSSVWTLQRFMSSYQTVGTSSSNLSGLTAAFAAIPQMVNLTTGTAPGSALPPNATLPVAEINSLANILAYCVNSSGGRTNTSGSGVVTSDGSPCGSLFADVTPSGGSAPTDTVGAALDIALNPGNAVSTIFQLAAPSQVFLPALSTAPQNWLIGINYGGAGLSAPNAIAIDSTGNVWATNGAAGVNSVSALSNEGVALTGLTGKGSGGVDTSSSGYTTGISGPSALAFDLSGNLWVANGTGNSVTELNSATGALMGSSPYNPSYVINAPSGLAIDGFGNIWVANSGTGSLIALNSSGVLIMNSGDAGNDIGDGADNPGGMTSPKAIAINAH